jgi:hypothetical protein
VLRTSDEAELSFLLWLWKKFECQVIVDISWILML